MLSLTEFHHTGNFTALPGNAFTQNPGGTGAGAGAERADCPSLRICSEKGWREQGAEVVTGKGHSGCLLPLNTYSSAQTLRERLTLGWGPRSRAPGVCWGCARGAPAVSPSTQRFFPRPQHRAKSTSERGTRLGSDQISFCSAANY